MKEYLDRLNKKYGRRLVRAANEAAPAAGTVDLSATPPGGIGAGNANIALAGLPNQRVTSFVSGLPQDSLEEILDFVAPPVGVGMKFEYVKGSAANALAVADDDEIGTNGLPKVISFEGDEYQQGKLAFRGMEFAYGEQEEKSWAVEPGGVTKQVNRRVTQTKQAILRARALRTFTLIGTAAATGNTVALLGTTSPIATMKALIKSVAEECGDRSMVRLLIGSQTYEWLTNHPKLTGEAGSSGQKTVTLEDLAKLLELPAGNLKVCYNQYNAAKQGKAVSKAYLFATDECLVFAAKQNATEDDPTAVKTFYFDQDGKQMTGYDYSPHPVQKRTGLKYYEKVMVTNSPAVLRRKFSYAAS